MHANVADTGESIPRCSYPVVLPDPYAQKWLILMLPCHGRGPVGAVEAIFMITRRQDSPERHSHFFWIP